MTAAWIIVAVVFIVSEIGVRVLEHREYKDKK